MRCCQVQQTPCGRPAAAAVPGSPADAVASLLGDLAALRAALTAGCAAASTLAAARGCGGAGGVGGGGGAGRRGGKLRESGSLATEELVGLEEFRRTELEIQVLRDIEGDKEQRREGEKKSWREDGEEKGVENERVRGKTESKRKRCDERRTKRDRASQDQGAVAEGLDCPPIRSNKEGAPQRYEVWR